MRISDWSSDVCSSDLPLAAIMSCLIIGDSIAVGIAGALGALHPHDCDVRATVGASVEAVSAMLPQRRYRSVIVAVGSNDSTRELRVRLPDLRARDRKSTRLNSSH